MAAATPPPAEDKPEMPAGQVRSAPRPGCYLAVLTWAFTLFNSVRVLAYLPTMWAIYSGGDSTQHSLWTWLTWLGANVTMAAWLYEQNARRANKAVVVTLCNATMCLLVAALILTQRLG